jgi:hypothetical protein
LFTYWDRLLGTYLAPADVPGLRDHDLAQAAKKGKSS